MTAFASTTAPVIRGIVIGGAGGHAVSVAETVRSAGHRILCFVDAEKYGDDVLKVPIASNIARILAEDRVGLLIAVGDNSVRQHLIDELLAIGRQKLWHFVNEFVRRTSNPSVILSN